MKKESYEWPTDLMGKDTDSSKILVYLDIPGFLDFFPADGRVLASESG